jgi:2-polyprenyl-3-methyl-5-hydroxy-6-metoxy-1,4-benzoquinol methylase
MNPDNFSNFYSESNLGFDLHLVKKGYQQFSEFFIGNSCLELGPATGYMTQYIVNDFDEVTCVEGSKDLIEKIPNYKNLNKVHSLFENFDTNKKFDTIILNHVLEHIQKPIELLEKIKRWKSEKGRLIIGVPNAKSFHRLAAVKMGILSSEYELNSRDVELGHYRVYDFKSLEKDCIDAGYKVISKGGVFIKFLSNAQIERFLDEKIIESYFDLGNEFKENSAEIFLVIE